MTAGLITTLDLLGVAVFAMSGALVASRKEMDVIGFGLMATLTGIGGGTLRDLILDRPVFWVSDQRSLVVCLGIALVAFVFASSIQRRYETLVWADALGLSLFAVTGAQIAYSNGADPLPAITMGMMTATFGGLARDIVAAETPLFLKPEIYASAALVAAFLFVGMRLAGFPAAPAVIVGVVAGFLVRGGAILYGWALPRYRPRAGRER